MTDTNTDTATKQVGLKISNIVELHTLDRSTVPQVAGMLVFPVPMDEITIGPGSILFSCHMGDNTLTSEIKFEEGSAEAIAELLDSLPRRTFLTGDGFLVVWHVGGFEIEAEQRWMNGSTLHFPNPDMQATE